MSRGGSSARLADGALAAGAAPAAAVPQLRLVPEERLARKLVPGTGPLLWKSQWPPRPTRLH